MINIAVLCCVSVQAWYHTVGEQKAPVFYCALGHFSHFYNGLGKNSYVTDILRAGLEYCGR